MVGLHLVDRQTIEQQIASDASAIIDVVESAYRAHWERRAVCPHSSFLRFPDSSNRIIALPSYVEDGSSSAAGIKWISSFPGNVARGLARASALIVLNDVETGVPISVMEGSAISAARTGAFSALAARTILPVGTTSRIGLIGCGPIAGAVMRYLAVAVPGAIELNAFDTVAERAQRFVADYEPSMLRARVASTMEDAIVHSDVVIFATTASAPYLEDPHLLDGCRLVLHVSLRDIGEGVIGRYFNVVDDEDHVLREQTSIHRCSIANPHRRVVDAELGDLLWGGKPCPASGTIVFSPFGLGILDIALAKSLLEQALASGRATSIEGFFESAF